MRRFELAVTLVGLVGACTVSDAPGGQDPEADESERPNADVSGHVAKSLEPRRYTIEEVPTDVVGGRSAVSKAICSQRAVVGTASVNTVNETRAIVFDASGVTVLPTLGGQYATGYDGNASGAIVGSSQTGSGTHAFLYSNGTIRDLGTLGGAYSSAHAINNRGQIVGQSTLIIGGDVPSHATLWEDCGPIDLGTLGGAESFARDINDAGVIVGTSSRADDPVRARATVWRDGVIAQLDDHDALHSQAVAINAAGTIAGFLVYQAASPYHAVIWRDGAMTDLGSFGNSAFALGLNERGDVVGMAWDANGTRPRAFLYSSGAMLDLEPLVDAPGWQLLQAVDICDDGRIIGNGWLYGQDRGFVLTPLH